MARRLDKAEVSLASAEGREAQTAAELTRVQEDLAIKTEENEILQDRYVSGLARTLGGEGRKAARCMHLSSPSYAAAFCGCFSVFVVLSKGGGMLFTVVVRVENAVEYFTISLRGGSDCLINFNVDEIIDETPA